MIEFFCFPFQTIFCVFFPWLIPHWLDIAWTEHVASASIAHHGMLIIMPWGHPISCLPIAYALLLPPASFNQQLSVKPKPLFAAKIKYRLRRSTGITTHQPAAINMQHPSAGYHHIAFFHLYFVCFHHSSACACYHHPSGLVSEVSHLNKNLYEYEQLTRQWK